MTTSFPFRAAILAAIAATAPLAAAAAESVRLEAPSQAASLHEGAVDMVMFYLPRGDHFEVVATYVDRDAASEPTRVRMGLTDGDSVAFGLPGQPDVLYRFTRRGSVVEVSSATLHEPALIAAW
jgi:hypothetical protein